MKKNWLVFVLFCSAVFGYGQEQTIIFESDSIVLSDTYISKNTSNNIFPSLYKNGLFYCSDKNGMGYRSYFSDLASKSKTIRLGVRYVFGPSAVFENEIYFTRYSTKSSSDGIFNVLLYKGQLEDLKVKGAKPMEICDKEFAYTHPAISKDGKFMVVVTNENGAFHLLSLKRTENGEWERDKVVFITQGKGEIINPTIYDSNTIYFALNSYDGKVKEVEEIYQDGKLVFTDVYREQGDFDIYMVKRSDGIWGIPHKAAVFNSEFDDLGVLFTTPNKGYLTTFRYNDADNIYFFELKK